MINDLQNSMIEYDIESQLIVLIMFYNLQLLFKVDVLFILFKVNLLVIMHVLLGLAQI